MFPAIALLLLISAPGFASTLWTWSYSGSGIEASGTFVTGDVPEPSGGYLITAISGQRNGDRIVLLQPVGTSIPGNEPFVVDNLIFLGPGPQLTKNGFGFGTLSGAFANPFYADFLPVPGYLDFFSLPGSRTSEDPIEFFASPVPEPQAVWFGLTGLAFFVAQRRSSIRR
jgi:hypothetical protein